jgi:aspartate aminotransferase
LSLRKAVVDQFKRDNGLTYTPAQILVSSGGKQSFFNLCQALLNKGDEVVVPAPYWVSYPEIVAIADATPVMPYAGPEQHYKLTPAQLEKAISKKTRLVVINSPSNPTGMAYRKAELQAFGEVLRKHPDVLIATDDMYEPFIWHGEPFCNILMACPDLYERTLVLNGCSKAYAMTGWRIGYAGGPESIIKAMGNMQSQSTSNPCSISQAAAEAALNGSQEYVQMMCKAFKERHDYVNGALNTMPGVSALPADGTFYAFADFSKVIQRFKLKDDYELCERLLVDAGVAAVAGSAFGAPGHVRMSFATSMDNLKGAMGRIAGWLQKA